MFSCESCKKRFFTKENFETHSKLLYGSCFKFYNKKNQISTFICDYCQTEFESNQELINHITTCNIKK